MANSPEVVADKIGPEPSPGAPAAQKGDYLIVRPKSGSAWRWRQVTGGTPAQAEVRLASGSSETVKPADYLVIKK